MNQWKYTLTIRRTKQESVFDKAYDVQKELMEWLGANGYDLYATDLVVAVGDYAREMYSESIYWLDEDAEDDELERLDQRCYDSMTDEDYLTVLRDFFRSSTIRKLFKLYVLDEDSKYQEVGR